MTRLRLSRLQRRHRYTVRRSGSIRTEGGAGALLHLPRTLQERRVLKLPPRYADGLDQFRAEPLRRNGKPTDGGGRQILSAVYPRSKIGWS